MEEETNNQRTGLAIGALVTGIIAFLMAVIPCVGIIAIVPAVIAIVLGIVGLSRANSNNGMLVGGLVIGVIALMISLSQSFLISKVARNSDKWGTEIEKAVKEISTDITDEFEDAKGDVSIKIRSNGDSIEIKAHGSRKDLEKQLDELESGSDSVSASVTIDIK